MSAAGWSPRLAASVSAVALLGLGVPVTFLSSLLLAFASDSCAGGREAPICATAVQLLVVLLPLAGLVTGFVLAVVGIARADEQRPARWIVASWATFAAALVVGFALALI